MTEFSHLVDLASARLGGEVVAANDEFFAGKENLIKPAPPRWIDDKYTDRGKWMDGWETRRRRTPGHDWCILRLGLPGIVHTFLVDTAFFTGNYPSHCSMDGCGLPPGADPTDAAIVWHPLLGSSELSGNTVNTFPLRLDPHAPRRVTHVRFNIFPDGGVARLRVLGESLPDWARILAGGGALDLASVVHGGYVVDSSDHHYGEPRNMLMPDRGANMADAWETKRRRSPGHDWAVIRLGIRGAIQRIEIDTAFHKGNYPDSASVEGAVVPDDERGVSADSATRAVSDWKTVLPQTPLQADHVHRFEPPDVREAAASHVRLNIFPDGGVSRFRVFGTPLPEARRAAVLRQLNALDEPEARFVLAGFCAAPAWIDGVMAARPFASASALQHASGAAFDRIDRDGWLAAFRQHPRLGERTDDGEALAQASREYEARFGYPFIASAAASGPGTLEALRARMANDPEAELRLAAEEQKANTRLRLERLLG